MDVSDESVRTDSLNYKKLTQGVTTLGGQYKILKKPQFYLLVAVKQLFNLLNVTNTPFLKMKFI